MPQLTVGLPLRNSSQYLREAIDSVRAQTFTDWILLAIDDASTDDTAEIVKAYAEQDSRIRFVQYGPEPASQAENWNRVIQLAETDYVSMFGHDDIMMPDLLARQIGMMDSNPLMSMVFAQGPLIDENGDLLRSRRGNPMLQPSWPEDRVLPPYSLGPQLICEGFVHPSSVMLRTHIARSIPLFPDDMPLYLDIDYWSRVGDCGPVGYLAGDLLRYRVRANSALTRAMRNGKNLSDAHKLFARMMAHWQWDNARQAAYKQVYYQAHAARALRGAEIAWQEADHTTARLQIAICLSLAQTAHSSPQQWIARWWNIRFGGGRFSSPRRLKLLTLICLLPILKRVLYRFYMQPLERLPHDTGS